MDGDNDTIYVIDKRNYIIQETRSQEGKIVGQLDQYVPIQISDRWELS